MNGVSEGSGTVGPVNDTQALTAVIEEYSGDAGRLRDEDGHVVPLPPGDYPAKVTAVGSCPLRGEQDSILFVGVEVTWTREHPPTRWDGVKAPMIGRYSHHPSDGRWDDIVEGMCRAVGQYDVSDVRDADDLGLVLLGERAVLRVWSSDDANMNDNVSSGPISLEPA